jgi:chitinase
VAYVDTIKSWWGCNVPEGIGMPTSPTTGPNVIVLSFWTTYGPADATTLWANLPQYVPDNCGFGSTTAEMQKSILNNFHKNGVKVIAAAFGATDYPTSKDPTRTCTELANFVLDNKLDGVDLDYEDSGAFEQGVGAQWLITCTKVLRQYLPKGQYILTHAPQGPYFTTASMYPDSAYLRIDKEVGELIDWYNLQYYNQGESLYTTYDDCFGASSAFPGTAVLELKGLNSKIAVGKPATQRDANNGWVPASTLAQWLQKANKEAGWCGGAMYWQLSSDTDKSFGSAMRKAVDSFSGCNKEMF